MNDKRIFEIRSFWNWFIEKKSLLNRYHKDEQVLTELDQKVREFGDISWEIGPGIKNPKNNALVISSGRRKDLFKISEKIISYAPKIEGWEFYSSIPPKQWDRIFIVEKNGERIEINANSWKYMLYGYPDKTYDIVISVPESDKYSKEFVHTIVLILLDSELGEEFRLKWIKDIDLVQAFTEEESQKSNSIQVLKEHMQMLIDALEDKY